MSEINGMYLAYPLLSEKEKQALEKLSSSEIKGIWALAVRDVVNDFDEMKFRELICQLKEAAGHNSVSMKRILGDAYESVVNL